jgi:hypothetical protein
MTERNVLLCSCLEKTLQGRTGYSVNGKRFCRTGFKKLYSVGNDRLQRVSQDIFLRVKNEVFSKEKSCLNLSFVQWMNTFLSINVESLPNKDIFHLPHNWTKKEVYNLFIDNLLLREEATISYKYFCKLWKQEFSRVRIPKRSRFSTCRPSSQFKALRDKATLQAEKSKSILMSLLFGFLTHFFSLTIDSKIHFVE